MPTPSLTPQRLPAVLFVDDEERVRHAFAGLFQGTYEVHTAASGAEALQLLRQKRFLAIVSDQRMPGMTGVELLREARLAAPGAVRLLLTGYSDLGIAASENESEIFRCITKPWQQDELKATLAEAIEVAIAAEAAAAGGGRYGRANGNVVVLGQPALARSLRELPLGAIEVHEADPDTVLDLVSRQDIGVVVSEVEAGGGEQQALLRFLGKESPHTQVVAIREPVNLSLLRQAVVSGLQRHAQLADGRRPRPHRLRRLLPSFRWLSARAAR